MKMWLRFDDVEIENTHETIMPTTVGRDATPGTLVVVSLRMKRGSGETHSHSYVGIYLACAPTMVVGDVVDGKIRLRMTEHTNTAIYIPELNRIVWNDECIWGEIDSRKSLESITNKDPNNEWYKRAWRQFKIMHEPD